jgi:hypothetical protein
MGISGWGSQGVSPYTQLDITKEVTIVMMNDIVAGAMFIGRILVFLIFTALLYEVECLNKANIISFIYFMLAYGLVSRFYGRFLLLWQQEKADE